MSDPRPATLGDVAEVEGDLRELEKRVRGLEISRAKLAAYMALIAFLGSIVGSAIANTLVQNLWIAGRVAH